MSVFNTPAPAYKSPHSLQTRYSSSKVVVAVAVVVGGGVVVVVDVVVDVVVTLSRIIKSVFTGQAPVTLELRNTPGKRHKQAKGGTHVWYTHRLYHS